MRILSRAYVVASIALLSPAVVLAHRSARRSLSFRPHLGVDFHTDPLPILDSRDPHEVAHAFLRKLAFPDDGYFIRKDSYTDETTGISHIYIRQIVNGLEVVDGNINLNVRGGQVLSYGNSFFEGSVESDILSVPNWHQAVYCSEASTDSNDSACGGTLDHLQATASRHAFDLATQHQDPLAAAFFLMQVTHPDPASLAIAWSTLEAKRHESTDRLEVGVSCQDWLLTAHSGGLEPIRARQVYVQTPGANGLTYLNLAWRLETSFPENHYVAYVSVHDPSKIISIADMVVNAPTPGNNAWQNTLQHHVFGQGQEILPSHNPAPLIPNHAGPHSDFPKAGTYRVWKWGVNDPASGERTLEEAPADWNSSPLGWHSVPVQHYPSGSHINLDQKVLVNYTTTMGNNVYAQEDWDSSDKWRGRHRPSGGSNLKFDFPYDEKAEPRQNIDQSITQLFYTANMYHDLLYQYGFDEASGNFQYFNFGKGGAGGDPIVVNAQESRYRNDATFSRTADGEQPICRMYLFDHSNPFRDGALDAGVLIHELTHGLSGRLTGGPSDKECLESHDAKGMGEGWSDFIATTVRSTSTYSDYPIAAWAYNSKEGIRRLPYSKHMNVNDWLYDNIRKVVGGEEHAIGKVWAQILYVVSNKLVDKHGFAPSLFPSAKSDFYRLVARNDGVMAKIPKHGNTLMLQLIVNAMKSQPCNPSFIQARDAIIAADEALTGGENRCALWDGFASRGMGTDAIKYVPYAYKLLNGFKTPSGC